MFTSGSELRCENFLLTLRDLSQKRGDRLHGEVTIFFVKVNAAGESELYFGEVISAYLNDVVWRASDILDYRACQIPSTKSNIC